MRFEIPGQGKVIGYYGADNQLLYHMEQLEEMIHVIGEMRHIRESGAQGSEALEDLEEGFAGVLICLEQLQEIYGIPNHVIQTMIYQKSSEQEKRIDEMPYWT